VNPEQGAIVRRIYEEYLSHRGLRAIAQRLNAEGVPGPKAGRRGSGTWAPSSIRPILMNARYRGVYIHGRIKKERHTSGIVRVKAAPDEVIVVDLPEWRIVDDTTWFAVAARFETRERSPSKKGHVKYALAGLGTCAGCGASIVGTRVSSYGGDSPRLITYGCSRYRTKGRTECPIRIHVPIEEVEDALITDIQDHVFGDENRAKLIKQLRAELTSQLPKQEADLSAMEAELVTTRTEHRRLTKAIALADNIPELVAELKQRVTRIEQLEAQLASARTTPSAIREFAAQAERAVLEQIDDLKSALADIARTSARCSSTSFRTG
jgi:site-specific DNA recombinase